MNKLSLIRLYILGLPKTIFFNLYYLPFLQAIKFPIIISNRVALKTVSGKIIISSDIRTGLIKIGFGSVGIFDNSRSRSIWECNGTIVFYGSANFGHGSKISVGSNGVLEFGDNFSITAESQIVCCKHISFGDNVLVSWQCLIMDTDFHKLIKGGEIINNDKEIIIGKKVWIGCRCTILKGTFIANGCVVAANSNVVKDILIADCIVGGNPAKVIKENICWNP